MADALVVLSAGSPSLKFSLYALADTALALEVDGQIEGLTDAARFVARDAHGAVIGDQRWPVHALDHDGATAHLLRFIGQELGRSTDSS